MSVKDMKTLTLAPQPAAQSFVSGQNDAAVTYEPYLSTVRANPTAGKILATTLDFPHIMDTVGCAPEWLKAHPKAAKALAAWAGRDEVSTEDVEGAASLALVHRVRRRPFEHIVNPRAA